MTKITRLTINSSQCPDDMNINTLSYPIIIGRRGYKKRYPENTMASFKAARDQCIQMIELDIRLSKDNRFPVIHDPTLERTTNGRGAVIEHTMTELKELDAGSWFHPDFACERIPALEELLIYTKDQMAVNIEMKFESGKHLSRLDISARLLANTLESLKIDHQVIISSFNYPFLKQLSTIKRSLFLGVLSKGKSAREMLPVCQSLNAYSWHTDYISIDQNQVDLIKSNGFRVFAYTVNDQLEVKRLIQQNIDAIISDELTLRL